MSTEPEHIVVGASAGGVEALSALLGELPAGLDAAVFVVLHVPPHVPSELPAILRRVARLEVIAAVDRAPIVSGRVYVAPADRHLKLKLPRFRGHFSNQREGVRDAQIQAAVSGGSSVNKWSSWREPAAD